MPAHPVSQPSVRAVAREPLLALELLKAQWHTKSEHRSWYPAVAPETGSGQNRGSAFQTGKCFLCLARQDDAMIYPGFQRVRLQDGRVVILKTEAVCEVSKADAQRFEAAAAKFKKNYPTYHLMINGDRKRVIAGILLEFEADKFSREDVFRWCAFAGEDLTAEEISSALNQLQRDKKRPIRLISEKGPNARWQVEKEALAAFHC